MQIIRHFFSLRTETELYEQTPINVCMPFFEVPAQDNEDLAINQTEDDRPNSSANRNIKYLTSELSKKSSSAERVQVK